MRGGISLNLGGEEIFSQYMFMCQSRILKNLESYKHAAVIPVIESNDGTVHTFSLQYCILACGLVANMWLAKLVV